MTKRYINPPIIEALCEFQFDPSSPWDLTLIGQLYDKLKETFPRRQQLQIALATTATPEIGIKVETTPMIPLVRFLDNDGKVLIQIGQNLLTINHLKPYASWEDFSPLIKSGFETYQEIANPKKFQHVGVRYINRIEIPKSRNGLEKYFRFRPFIPQNLPQDIDSLVLGVSLPYEDSKDTLRIQLGTANPEAPDMLVFLLDISYIFAKPGEITLESILARLDAAHKYIEDAFESCLTDDLRQLFGEVKE